LGIHTQILWNDMLLQSHFWIPPWSWDKEGVGCRNHKCLFWSSYDPIERRHTHTYSFRGVVSTFRILTDISWANKGPVYPTTREKFSLETIIFANILYLGSSLIYMGYGICWIYIPWVCPYQSSPGVPSLAGCFLQYLTHSCLEGNQCG
jgi:hypothetical protein